MDKRKLYKINAGASLFCAVGNLCITIMKYFTSGEQMILVITHGGLSLAFLLAAAIWYRKSKKA
ncbi:hypothetical protein AALA82_03150 [Oscillospiraceae bacterium 50-16]|nr:hypothetical protein [Lawsonibacter sp.]